MSDILKAAALQAATTIMTQQMRSFFESNRVDYDDDEIQIEVQKWYEKFLAMLTYDANRRHEVKAFRLPEELHDALRDIAHGFEPDYEYTKLLIARGFVVIDIKTQSHVLTDLARGYRDAWKMV